MQPSENTSLINPTPSLGEDVRLDLTEISSLTIENIFRDLCTEIDIVLGLEKQKNRAVELPLQARVDRYYSHEQDRPALSILKQEISCFLDPNLCDSTGERFQGANHDRPLEVLKFSLRGSSSTSRASKHSLCALKAIFETAIERSKYLSSAVGAFHKIAPDRKELGFSLEGESQKTIGKQYIDGGMKLFEKDQRRFQRVIELIDQALTRSEYRKK